MVIGGGLSGLFAAVTAAEHGVGSIAVFEKGNHLGGNGRIGRTFVSSDFKDFGNYDDPKNAIGLFKRGMNTLKQTANADMVRRYLFNVKWCVKWLEEHGVDRYWTWVVGGGPFFSKYSRNVEADDAVTQGRGIGMYICDALEEALKSYDGVDIFLNTPAKHLLTDSSGDVCGVVVESEGRQVGVSSKKLILSTGGVGGSFASLRKYLPFYMDDIGYMNMGGVRTCTGDGIDMCGEIGAEVGTDMNIHLLGPGYAGDRGSRMGSFTNDPRSLIVNKRGERVMDENHGRDAQGLCNRQPGKVLYYIYGKNSFSELWSDAENGLLGMPGHGHGPKGAMPSEEQIAAMASDDEDAVGGPGGMMGIMPPPGGPGGPRVDRNSLRKVDVPWDQLPELLKNDLGANTMAMGSVEEIAAFIGCDPAALQATIDEYDAACEKGVDEKLYKDPKYLTPLGGAPYAALWSVRSMDSTQGGIVCGADLEARRPDGSTIGGMYVTGDHVTGFVSSEYGPGGAGMSFAMASGYLAGMDAAAELASN